MYRRTEGGTEMKKIMEPRRVRMDDRGDMGIGTLIIFIALILVSAVAAGVLVQTAYTLQQQAEATGDQAIKEVSTGLRVLALYGTTDGNLTYITDLYMKVALSAGSPVINLYDLVIEISTGIADSSLSYTGSATPGTGLFNVTSIRDTYPYNIWTTTDVGITQGDIALIHVNLTAQGMDLRTQQDATALLIPKHGIPTFVMLTTPSVYSNIYELLN
jgi:flagellin FlaB